MWVTRNTTLRLTAAKLSAAPARKSLFIPSRRTRTLTSGSTPVPLLASTFVRMASTQTLPRLPIFEAIARHDPQSTAVVHSLSGRRFTYGDLLRDVAERKEKLRESADGKSTEGERIAFLVENSYDYVVTLLSILGSHAIAVPMSPAFPPSELRYIIDQSQALMLLSSEKFRGKAEAVVSEGLEHQPTSVPLQKILQGKGQGEKISLESPKSDKGGMMLYTSGTTNRPKGVLIPISALEAQSRALIEAWEYSPADHLLHVLPLHHIHGTVNAILTPLFAGSSIEFMFPFNVDAVWNRLAAPFLPHQTNGAPKETVTFFTVVPTIYNRLLASHGKLSPEMQEATKKALTPENMRLAISGSAALPAPTKDAWRELSGGNVLLERYGMTEVGMALSCGLDFTDRIDGSVGWPLPSVEARLVDTETGEVIQDGEELDAQGRERHGEIQLRGPTIFQEYWRNPEATAKEFVPSTDGGRRWFKTGDVAVRRAVPGSGEGKSGDWARGKAWFIQGRKSADIIKTGGEKVSALEVERELLSLPEVAECAVVALDSVQWGQRVAAVVVLTEKGMTAGKGGKPWGPMDMRRALKDRLANYKIPQEMKLIDAIPRNAMGKINKKALVQQVFADRPPTPPR